MPSFNKTAIRLYKKFFGVPQGAVQTDDGVETVLDGNSAVAVAEACIADTAAVGSTFPPEVAGLAWRLEQDRQGANVYGGILDVQEGEGPRGALAAAMGISASGLRATTFLSGQDLAATQDLLVSAAGRHLPLVIHVSNRALAAHGGALGSGHEAFHLSSDSGFFTLFAANVQEAVDFTLIARRVAELALVPGMVVMDEEQTALAAQDVKLLSPTLVKKIIGPAKEAIEVPNAAQKLLFGDTRRRVPRWHNLDRPVLQGALQDGESFALGAVAQQPYFGQYLGTAMEESLALFGRHTGRNYSALSTHGMDKAKLVLVAQGAAIETARAVSDHLGKSHKLKVGVLGIHCLRPLPGAEIAKYLTKKQAVAILERLDTPLATDPPLLREIRACMDRAQENGRFGEDTHPGYPALREAERPRLHSVIYGLGGSPLRAADLTALGTELEGKGRSRIYLGIDFAHSSAAHPKRQVLLDTLVRAYPEISRLGLRAGEASPDVRPDGAVTVALHRVLGKEPGDMAVKAGALLKRVAGGRLRSRPDLSWERWGRACADRLTVAPEGLQDPGDDAPVDLAVITTPGIYPLMQPLTNLRAGGALLLASPQADKQIWQELPPDLQAAIRKQDLAIYYVSVPQPPSPETDAGGERKAPPGGFVPERLLGGMFAALLDMDMLDVKARRIISAAEEILKGEPGEEPSGRLEAFRSGFEDLRNLSHLAATSLARPPDAGWPDEAPMAVRHLGRIDTAFDSLPRFWDQVGVLYRNGETGDLTSDPYMGTGTVPPLSSNFRDMSDTREMLPAFSPADCTGCGDCWTACPDSAIGAVAVGPGTLIDAGIRLAGADPVKQASSKLASRIISLAKKGETQAVTAGGLLEEAYAWLGEKMPLPEDRRQAMDAGVKDLIGGIGSLPVAITDAFFHEAEKTKKEGGELLTLVINPSACKGCGSCVAACQHEALDRVPQNTQRVADARKLWDIWQNIPDTPSETIQRVSEIAEIGPMSAVLMSRFCQFAVAGGDGAEPGSGEKIAVRLLLGATEYHQQPQVHLFIQEINDVRGRILEKIREALVNALPTEDLDVLAAGIDQAQTAQIDLSTLSKHAEAAIEGGGVDATHLGNLIELARGLDDLLWRMSKGQNGLGRSRFGLAVAPGTVATWAGVFPHNPFEVPVTVDMSGEVAQLAAGLLEGHIAVTCEAMELMRRARAESEQGSRSKEPGGPLSWRDLNEKERNLCPPLLLIGNETSLGGHGFTQIAWLLNSGLPVKVLVLSDLDFGLDTQDILGTRSHAIKDPKSNLGLLALAQRRAYVAQTSIGAPAHMRKSVQGAMKFAGPVLIRIHTPSPERHGFPMDQTLAQARLAVSSRAFPLFRYEPDKDGVFGSRLTLDGNPEPREPWSMAGSGEAVTPAHWAITESRFDACFPPLSGDDTAPTTLPAYLDMDPKGRKGKTPFVAVAGEEDTQARYRVSTGVVEMVAEQSHVWRTLQELAGLVTPFTARVEQEAREKLAAEHQADLDKLKQDYEDKIRSIQEGMHTETATEIRGRLLTLAGYK